MVSPTLDQTYYDLNIKFILNIKSNDTYAMMLRISISWEVFGSEASDI